MKFYLKVFFTSFMFFLLIIGVGLYLVMYANSGNTTGAEKGPVYVYGSPKIEFTEQDRESLERMTAKSHRLNVLIMGTDGGRSDTMMLVSLDPDAKLVDIVSLPRDTYHKMAGRSAAKLNSVIGLKGEDGGPQGVTREVSKILGVPVKYYVSVDYEAVKDVVNILGGVEVEIDTRMKYDDPYCKPPLHIDFQPGKQVLDGDDAIRYLRWRKNNNGSGPGDDLHRIERQQQFVKNAIKKALGLKLPLVISAGFKYVKTDMPLKDMLNYGTGMLGVDMSKVRSYRIPGEAKTLNSASYYLHYPKQTETMMLSIYNRTGEETPLEGTITELKEIDPDLETKGSKQTVVKPDPEKTTPQKTTPVKKNTTQTNQDADNKSEEVQKDKTKTNTSTSKDSNKSKDKSETKKDLPQEDPLQEEIDVPDVEPVFDENTVPAEFEDAQP